MLASLGRRQSNLRLVLEANVYLGPRLLSRDGPYPVPSRWYLLLVEGENGMGYVILFVLDAKSDRLLSYPICQHTVAVSSTRA